MYHKGCNMYPLCSLSKTWCSSLPIVRYLFSIPNTETLYQWKDCYFCTMRIWRRVTLLMCATLLSLVHDHIFLVLFIFCLFFVFFSEEQAIQTDKDILLMRTDRWFDSRVLEAGGRLVAGRARWKSRCFPVHLRARVVISESSFCWLILHGQQFLV